jgi:hypothetical protein
MLKALTGQSGYDAGAQKSSFAANCRICGIPRRDVICPNVVVLVKFRLFVLENCAELRELNGSARTCRRTASCSSNSLKIEESRLE